MTFSQNIAATVLISACALSTNVNAEETALEQIVSNLVANALHTANNQIEIQIEKTLLTASNSISVENESVPANRITITDLASIDNEIKNENKDNQTQKTDD